MQRGEVQENKLDARDFELQKLPLLLNVVVH